MPRGYRYVIVAAVGCLTLCAQHQNPAVNTEQGQADARVSDALTNIATTYREQTKRAKRAPESQPCGPAEYKSNDDLCAQWKAADAAEKSAWWAAFAGWFGGLSFIGVLAAVALAFHSNWIARDTAKRQLRAYIGVGACSITELEQGRGFVISAELVNSGQTPAYNAKIMGESFGAEYPLQEDRPFLPEAEGYDSPVMPGESLHCAYRLTTDDPQEALGSVFSGSIGFYIQGTCTYCDAFGVKRETKFRYVFGGRVANTNGLVMHAAERGNSAT